MLGESNREIRLGLHKFLLEQPKSRFKTNFDQYDELCEQLQPQIIDNHIELKKKTVRKPNYYKKKVHCSFEENNGLIEALSIISDTFGLYGKEGGAAVRATINRPIIESLEGRSHSRKIKIAVLGSGPGIDALYLLQALPAELRKNIHIDCFDLSEGFIAAGMSFLPDKLKEIDMDPSQLCFHLADITDSEFRNNFSDYDISTICFALHEMPKEMQEKTIKNACSMARQTSILEIDKEKWKKTHNFFATMSFEITEPFWKDLDKEFIASMLEKHSEYCSELDQCEEAQTLSSVFGLMSHN